MGLKPDGVPSGPLCIERLTVGSARVRALVRLTDGAPLRTSELPAVSDLLLEAMPGIGRHRCRCGSSHGIIAELADTELAHLLEHIALELMALAGSPRTLSGETRWDFASDGRGVFRVEIDYDDDLAAIAALNAAAEAVGLLFAGDLDRVWVARTTERMSGMRGGKGRSGG